jgi:homopolymeric O-antigen transport system permease protein
VIVDGQTVGVDQRAQPPTEVGIHSRNQRAVHAIVIEPRRGWATVDPREIWRYRDLLYFLTWRDIKVRYKQTVFGAAWAVVQPFLTMVAFSVIFGRLIGVSSEGIPYPVFSYVALLPWTFISTAVNRSANSLVSSANLISKVYFPRLLVPTSSVLAITVDFGIAFVILIAIMLFYGIAPGLAVVLLPLFLLLGFITALGVGLWLAALNVRYRDVTHLLPFLIQFWLFASPVAYSGRVVPQEWQLLYAVNPVVAVVAGFRWTLLGLASPSTGPLIVSVAVAAMLLVSGLLYFRRTEDDFADVV